MASVRLTAVARCHGCAWTAEGEPAAVDRAAAKHVKPGHAVATVATPVRRSVASD